ncbi:MAG TPA: acyltransferase [Steroidobacteraceae bacterium]|nr:acyltransferase [Steroidobacteraceae bacterium]
MTARPLANSAIPSLDGIRAVAVALVFFAHSGLEHVVPGGLGVTIFFVLSGYLISTLMRVEFQSHGRIDFRGFYLRRFLRLMPPLTIIVALTLLLSALSIVDAFAPNGLLAVLFYYGNYFVIAHDFQGVPAGMSVVWSLAVEEHFYLLYPPLAVMLLRIGRAGLSAKVLVSLCVAVLAWRCWLATHDASENYISMATDTRIDAILIGCLLALWKNPWLDRLAPSNSTRDAALIVGALALLFFTLGFRDEFFRMTFRYTLQSLATAVLLYFAIARSTSAPFTWLNSRPLMYVGGISYTVYLSHHLIIEALRDRFSDWGWAPILLVSACMTLIIAEAMRRFVEQPCARLRKRLHKKPILNERTAAPIAPVASGGSL